jgi:hypothetical protein
LKVSKNLSVTPATVAMRKQGGFMKTLLAMGVLLLGGYSALAQTTEPALCGAARIQDTVAVRTLLTQGASPNVLCNTLTPFGLASPFTTPAQKEIAQLLIASGDDASNLNTYRGSWSRRSYFSDFDLACRNSSDLVVDFLNKGVNPLTVDLTHGQLTSVPLNQVLFMSTYDIPNKIRIADMLIAKGVSPYSVVGTNRSLLDFFLINKLPVEQVVARIANWNFANDPQKQNDYLVIALQNHAELAAIQELVKVGASLTALMPTGQSPLALYLQNSYPENQPADLTTLNWLLAQHMDANEYDGAPLMAAITSQPPQVIDTLLHAGADANLHTPLAEIGSRKDAVAIATVLFKYNAKVNQLSSQNETPLMNATAYENVELARFLLAKGARVNQQNSDGQTALCFAYSGTAVAKLLQANGGHRANCPAN